MAVHWPQSREPLNPLVERLFKLGYGYCVLLAATDNDQTGKSQTNQGQGGRLGNSGDLDVTVGGNIRYPNIRSNGLEAVLNMAARVVDGSEADVEHPIHQRHGCH